MRSGRPSLTADQQARLIEIIEANALAREALYLWPRAQSRAPRVGRYGGLPGLPDGVDWPVSQVTGEPLNFLFQIACNALPAARNPARGLLPQSDLLLLFGGLTWPHIESQAGHLPHLMRIIHAPQADAGTPGRPLPPGMSSPFDLMSGYADLESGFSSPDGISLPEVSMHGCAAAELYPPGARSAILADPVLTDRYERLMPLVGRPSSSGPVRISRSMPPGGRPG